MVHTWNEFVYFKFKDILSVFIKLKALFWIFSSYNFFPKNKNLSYY